MKYSELETKEINLKNEINELFHQFQKASKEAEKEKLRLSHDKKVFELRKIIKQMENWKI